MVPAAFQPSPEPPEPFEPPDPVPSPPRVLTSLPLLSTASLLTSPPLQFPLAQLATPHLEILLAPQKLDNPPSLLASPPALVPLPSLLESQLCRLHSQILLRRPVLLLMYHRLLSPYLSSTPLPKSIPSLVVMVVCWSSSPADLPWSPSLVLISSLPSRLLCIQTPPSQSLLQTQAPAVPPRPSQLFHLASTRDLPLASVQTFAAACRFIPEAISIPKVMSFGPFMLWCLERKVILTSSALLKLVQLGTYCQAYSFVEIVGFYGQIYDIVEIVLNLNLFALTSLPIQSLAFRKPGTTFFSTKPAFVHVKTPFASRQVKIASVSSQQRTKKIDHISSMLETMGLGMATTVGLCLGSLPPLSIQTLVWVLSSRCKPPDPPVPPDPPPHPQASMVALLPPWISVELTGLSPPDSPPHTQSHYRDSSDQPLSRRPSSHLWACDITLFLGLSPNISSSKPVTISPLQPSSRYVAFMRSFTEIFRLCTKFFMDYFVLCWASLSWLFEGVLPTKSLVPENLVPSDNYCLFFPKVPLCLSGLVDQDSSVLQGSSSRFIVLPVFVAGFFSAFVADIFSGFSSESNVLPSVSDAADQDIHGILIFFDSSCFLLIKCIYFYLVYLAIWLAKLWLLFMFYLVIPPLLMEFY